MTSYGSHFSAKEIVSDEVVCSNLDCSTLDAGDCARLNVNSLLDSNAPVDNTDFANVGDLWFHQNGASSAIYVCTASNEAAGTSTWLKFGEANASGV
jgi:hypothetical protein